VKRMARPARQRHVDELMEFGGTVLVFLIALAMVAGLFLVGGAR